MRHHTSLALIAATLIGAMQAGSAEAQEPSCAVRLETAGPESISAADVLGCLVEMQTEIEALREQAAEAVPDGAVVAFESNATLPCPGDDWTIFAGAEGRFIVGAGLPEEAGLTPRRVNDKGGEEKHELSVVEIPSHHHSMTLLTAEDGWGLVNDVKDDDVRHKGRVLSAAGSGVQILTTGVFGGNSDKETVPHNNLPPFIALNFCKKDRK